MTWFVMCLIDFKGRAGAGDTFMDGADAALNMSALLASEPK